MSQTPTYPTLRPRRLRLQTNLRRMVRETTLSPADLIYPLFVRPGRDIRRPISSMPGQFQWSVDRLAAEAKELAALGLPAVILFGIPEIKEHDGAVLPAPNVGEHQITMAPSDIVLSGVVRQLAKSLSQFLPKVLEFRIVFLIGKPSHKGQQV